MRRFENENAFQMIKEENVVNIKKNHIALTPFPRAGGRAWDRGRTRNA